jgi:hypothetical protein
MITPYRGRNRTESQKTANHSHARLADAAACRFDPPPGPGTRPTAAIGVSEAELGQRIEAAGVGHLLRQHARGRYAPSTLRRFGASTIPSDWRRGATLETTKADGTHLSQRSSGPDFQSGYAIDTAFAKTHTDRAAGISGPTACPENVGGGGSLAGRIVSRRPLLPTAGDQ